ncbi:PREDICTED: centromere-associated protein E-like [Priapulus caudatus]|uniref:Centromere-associated protein E-like n=1 Tax=Priapulus caudatus TaxID=37621 RepID=A0ABM1EN84_PRICU|nr:PREDICTED: centromere-associated protein E-like [Priapulus caudatus]
MDNVHVVVRVRPLIKREADSQTGDYWKVLDSQTIASLSETQGKRYTFDRVFGCIDSTNTVYENVAKPIVQGAVKGINGTIFAYGQTGTGKTYTMMGSDTTCGVIPCAVKEMFDYMNHEPNREFLVRVSYLEIYNESLSDLLRSKGKKEVLTIHENEVGRVYVSNLCEELTNSYDQIMGFLREGEKYRRVGATNMNDRSSRSHTIFRIIIESRANDEEGTGVVSVAHLNFVDLAGSERANQTGAMGERLKEGCSINASLFQLSEVISQLSKGAEHINFRNSKLTRILQNSLGGNAKTAIICNITQFDLQQTSSTLKFASRAKKIKNKPIVNEVVNDEAMLRRYRREIDDLKRQLESAHQPQERTDHLVSNLEKELAERDRKQKEQEQMIELYEKIINGPVPKERGMKRNLRRETWCPGQTKNILPTTPVHSRFPGIGNTTIDPFQEEPLQEETEESVFLPRAKRVCFSGSFLSIPEGAAVDEEEENPLSAMEEEEEEAVEEREAAGGATDRDAHFDLKLANERNAVDVERLMREKVEESSRAAELAEKVRKLEEALSEATSSTGKIQVKNDDNDNDADSPDPVETPSAPPPLAPMEERYPVSTAGVTTRARQFAVPPPPQRSSFNRRRTLPVRLPCSDNTPLSTPASARRRTAMSIYDGFVGEFDARLGVAAQERQSAVTPAADSDTVRSLRRELAVRDEEIARLREEVTRREVDNIANRRNDTTEKELLQGDLVGLEQECQGKQAKIEMLEKTLTQMRDSKEKLERESVRLEESFEALREFTRCEQDVHETDQQEQLSETATLRERLEATLAELSSLRTAREAEVDMLSAQNERQCASLRALQADAAALRQENALLAAAGGVTEPPTTDEDGDKVQREPREDRPTPTLVERGLAPGTEQCELAESGELRTTVEEVAREPCAAMEDGARELRATMEEVARERDRAVETVGLFSAQLEDMEEEREELLKEREELLKEKQRLRDACSGIDTLTEEIDTLAREQQQLALQRDLADAREERPRLRDVIRAFAREKQTRSDDAGRRAGRCPEDTLTPARRLREC